MRHLVLIGLLIAITAVGRTFAQENEPSAALALQQSLIDVIQSTEQGVVVIAVMRSSAEVPIPIGADLFEALLSMEAAGPIPARLGSGIVIDKNLERGEALILTTAHLVEPAIAQEGTEPPATIAVRSTSRVTASATIHASDPRSDLAVLKVSWPDDVLESLTVLEPGREEELVKGSLVVGLGNPWGLARDGSCSAALGMISNIGRRPHVVPAEENLEEPLELSGTLLQVDLRLAPGMSGAALVDLQGKLVGMVSALATPARRSGPVTYAIPFNEGTRRILNSLRAGYEVEYGFLGVSVETSPGPMPPLEELRPGTVARVHRVAEGSPGDACGLRSDDLIYRVNGNVVETAEDLTREIALLGPGSEARLLVYRPNTRGVLVLEATLGKWPVADDSRIVATSQRHPLWRGIRVDYATSRRRFLPGPFFSESLPAVVVTEVIPESPADQSGVKVGQFIAKVGEQPVETPAKFYESVASWPGATPVGFLDGSEVLIENGETATPKE